MAVEAGEGGAAVSPVLGDGEGVDHGAVIVGHLLEPGLGRAHQRQPRVPAHDNRSTTTAATPRKTDGLIESARARASVVWRVAAA